MQNGSKAIVFPLKETGFVLLFLLLLFSLLAYPCSIRSLLRYWVFNLALNENIAFPPDLK